MMSVDQRKLTSVARETNKMFIAQFVINPYSHRQENGLRVVFSHNEIICNKKEQMIPGTWMNLRYIIFNRRHKRLCII